MKKNWRRNKNK